MLISSNNLLKPKFSGSYLEKSRATETSKDRKKETQELAYGEDVFYINNDDSGHDLEQFRELTKNMFQYDFSIPPHKQDQGLTWLDWGLLNRRLYHLHSIALENYSKDNELD